MQSHLSVAYGAAVWLDRRNFTNLKQAVVGRLLERLIEDRTIVEVRAIIEGWVELERQRARGGWIIPYIADWLRGHFIELKSE